MKLNYGITKNAAKPAFMNLKSVLEQIHLNSLLLYSKLYFSTKNEAQAIHHVEQACTTQKAQRVKFTTNLLQVTKVYFISM